MGTVTEPPPYRSAFHPPPSAAFTPSRVQTVLPPLTSKPLPSCARQISSSVTDHPRSPPSASLRLPIPPDSFGASPNAASRPAVAVKRPDSPGRTYLPVAVPAYAVWFGLEGLRMSE